MFNGEINPRYHKYYVKAHEERAAAVQEAFDWLFRRQRKTDEA
ncbi:MAG: hypothetical protein AAGP08_16665 [Pseudomonadota bacterium]